MYGQIDWDSMEWELVVEGIRRKVVHLKGATVVLNLLDPGNEPFPHSHPHEQVSYIKEGELEFTIDGETHPLNPGDLLAVPPEAEHYAVAVGHKPCLNLDFFTPKRDDYNQSPAKSQD
jgi:quercetin dioxygenase-like cupin family protein